MQVSLVLGAGIMLVVQRVAPLARIWSYLETFYLIFAVIGLAWNVSLLIKTLASEQIAGQVISIITLLIVFTWFANKTITTYSRKAILDRTIAPEQLAAEYLAKHITENDTIISIAPTDYKPRII